MSDPVAEAAAQIAEEQTVSNLGVPEAGTAAAGESPQSSPASTTSTTPEPSSAELPNVDASMSPAGAAISAATDGELPNVASVADDPTAAQDSAPNAAGANTTLPIDASSAEPPLHMRIAMHLEAIYTMAREHVEAAPKEAAEQAQTVKTHIGDILHRISNGISVAEGELVQKLEALYRVL